MVEDLQSNDNAGSPDVDPSETEGVDLMTHNGDLNVNFLNNDAAEDGPAEVDAQDDEGLDGQVVEIGKPGRGLYLVRLRLTSLLSLRLLVSGLRISYSSGFLSGNHAPMNSYGRMGLCNHNVCHVRKTLEHSAAEAACGHDPLADAALFVIIAIIPCTS